MSVRTSIPTDSDTRVDEATESVETTRVPEAPADDALEPTCELDDLDRYVVQLDRPVGYVEVVPPVFVCYVGHPYALAEEVAQVVQDFDRAVEIVAERAAVSRRHKLAT
jgi:hypothetical protein